MLNNPLCRVDNSGIFHLDSICHIYILSTFESRKVSYKKLIEKTHRQCPDEDSRCVFIDDNRLRENNYAFLFVLALTQQAIAG